jgi:hypothetical protein
MGTRHLINVVKNNKPVIAQYGQWDGYPDGQGVDVLEFLHSELFGKLKANLGKLRFIDFEGKDAEFIKRFDSGKGTDSDKEWFELFISRNVGADILTNVAKSDRDEILLKDSYDFGNDTVSCEYIYSINLDNDTLTIQPDFKSEPMKAYSLSELPDKESFLADLTECEE